MLSHAEKGQMWVRSSFGVIQESSFHCTNNGTAQRRGDDQNWFQPAISCYGGKLSLRKGLGILRRVRCCISGGAVVRGDRKVMQLPFLQKWRQFNFPELFQGKNPTGIKDSACWKPTEMPSRAEWYQNNHWSVQTDLSYKTSYPSTSSSSQGQWGGAAWALLNYWVRKKHMENLRMRKQHKMSL